MVRMELAARLKYYREKSGLSIYEVGKIIGKSGKTVSAWENGRGQPDADMLLTLCGVYGIKSISDLYGENPLTEAFDKLTPHEQQVINAYRDKPEMQKAVDTLLGIDIKPPEGKTLGEEMKDDAEDILESLREAQEPGSVKKSQS